jgi:hypothetical protein
MMLDKKTFHKGYLKIKEIESKLLIFFENDDRNVFFEAIYSCLFLYYSE